MRARKRKREKGKGEDGEDVEFELHGLRQFPVSVDEATYFLLEDKSDTRPLGGNHAGI